MIGGRIVTAACATPSRKAWSTPSAPRA